MRDDRQTALRLEKLIRSNAKPEEIDAEYEGTTYLTLTGFVEEFETPENIVELGVGTNKFKLPATKITYRTPLLSG